MQCVVPMATHLQTNDAHLVIKGYVFCQITRGAHTSSEVPDTFFVFFWTAQRFFVLYGFSICLQFILCPPFRTTCHK